MDAPKGSPARPQRASWVLLLALMPMLTFMGHWPSSLPIPGTGLYVTVPLAGPAPNAGSEEHHDHSKHCHGEAASCADAPVAAGVGLALMNTLVSIPPATGLLFITVLVAALPLRSNTLAPEPRPPRGRTAKA